MKIKSPLKILGLLTITLGLAIGVLTYGYLIVLGLIFIGVGIIVCFIDFLTIKLTKNKKVFWISQSALTICYLILAFVVYMNWQEHNYIIFPKGFKGQAGIIFGIENYPELPKTKFWKKTIRIPENGILATCTKVEDIPGTIRYAFSDNQQVNVQRVDWDPNFEIDCIINDSKIKGWLFRVDSVEGSVVKEMMTSFCNEISENGKSSYYKNEHPILWTDDKGKYLWLQNKGLTALPNGLSNLNIYKAILTGNDLKEVPEQILEIQTLEDLILASNPIKEFPCSIIKLKRLKSVSFAETAIREINCDLSYLDSLEHFDISRNHLTIFPKRIKTIPNLTWLSLGENDFNDFSFIDKSFEKLETLYLQSNNIRSISNETKFLKNLSELLIFDNEIDSIPDNISDLKKLKKLEIWDNPIKYISPKIAALANLKSMRIDDDYLTQTDKDNLRKWLPNCEINYQTRSAKKIPANTN